MPPLPIVPHLNAIAQKLNTRPRKTLGYATPLVQFVRRVAVTSGQTNRLQLELLTELTAAVSFLFSLIGHLLLAPHIKRSYLGVHQTGLPFLACDIISRVITSL